MRWLAVVVPILAPHLGLSGEAHADMVVASSTTARDTERGIAELTQAIRASDGKAVRAQLATSLVNGGVWFPDRACAKQFAAPGPIDAKAAPAFARCLARLTPQLSTRRSSRRDGAVLTYAPGLELELTFRGAQVRWIGPPVHHGDAPVPLLTAQAFEALRTRGTTLVDDAVAPTLAGKLGKRRSVSAWLEVCLDAEGKVTKLTHHDATSAEIGDAFVEAARSWAFRPFAVRGAPVEACSLSMVTYPSRHAPAVETLPRASTGTAVNIHDFDDLELDGVLGGRVTTITPPSLMIAARTLERLRVTGKADIQPDAPTRRAMIQAKKLSVSARARVCIDVQGGVTTVSLIRRSGFAAYDAQLVREIRRWRFRPHVVGGTKREACATVTFMVTPDPTMNNP